LAEPDLPSWPVPAALDGERLDRAVAIVTGLSRRSVGDLVAAGRVRLDRRPVRDRSRRVGAGQELAVDAGPEAGPAGLAPDPSVAVGVVHADPALIVVDKPAGLVVHPGHGHRGGTLIQGLLARFPDLAALPVGDGDQDRPGIVQRLDRGTSGLLVVARTPEARSSLVGQLARREVRREYRALVTGTVDGDEGLVDGPIGRSDRDPTRFRVQTGGRPARTRYRVDARGGPDRPVTLLTCRLETGRTHQIRVHLASIGHPVVGDDRYGGRAAQSAAAGRLASGRLFLHASVLGFVHPQSGAPMTFQSELPEDLASCLRALVPGPGGPHP
jgi:23S rRNA pseudouridine1911/1915/1917 synthase